MNVEGGELLALGGAASYNEAGYLGRETDTYYGEALAVVRARGTVVLRAASPYGNAEVRVECRAKGEN